jgi:APA family basic amino acid/polyamine antiporter
MVVLSSFILVSFAVPILRKNHPELSGKGFEVPFGPWLIPALSAVSSSGMIVSLMFSSPTIGHMPLPLVGYVVWFLIGIPFYCAYGRKYSVVSKDEEQAA